ncbi:MAG: hypothetical protein NZ528_11345 [Caldilineales bacterium]|nr:hypothetical protein [Caldilineales bacterium]MDW8317713.1 translation elongation factor-like protein [Anaerolineae bacterium]
MEEHLIGRVTHYFTRLCVAGVALSDTLEAGDIVRFRGKHTDLIQRATSIQLHHLPVRKAEAGQEVGVLVDRRVRPGDRVYRLSGPDAEALLPREELNLHDLDLER